METYLPDILLALGAVAAGLGGKVAYDERNKRNTVAQHVAVPDAPAPEPFVSPHTHEYRVSASEVTMGEKIVIKVCWRCEPGTPGRIFREVVNGNASPE